MAVPLIVSAMLAVPVPIAWYLASQDKKRKDTKPVIEISNAENGGGEEENPINWRLRYENTVDTFLNNIMFWVFIIYPGQSFVTMQTFVCKKIAETTYLTADYYERCPYSYGNFGDLGKWNSLAAASACYFFIYPIGIPLFMILVMRAHRIPELKRKKVGSSLISSMIAEYMSATSTASSQRLASFLGMKRDTNLVSRNMQEAEFERRSEALYVEIFPEHHLCSADCAGHTLPDLPSRFLQEMDYPSDLPTLINAARAWFERIDISASGALGRADLSKEFVRLGISEHAAFSIWQYHDTDQSNSLSFEQFCDMILHLIENSHSTLTAADMLALGRLMRDYDADSSGTLDLGEFKELARELAEINIFNGREAVETLDPRRLYVLREFNWKRREIQKMEEGDDGPDNRRDQISNMKSQFDVEKKPTGDEAQDEEAQEPAEPMYKTTKAMKAELEKTCRLINEICETCFPNTDLNVRAGKLEYDSKDLFDVVFEVKQKVHFVLCENLNEHGPAQSLHSLFEHSMDENATYAMLIQVEKIENSLRSILLDQVLDIAYTLEKEGLISVSTLEWDGSLGREEQVVINRLGFLLNAYSVQSYYWEFIEMARKLILTSFLSVLYQGSTEHLAGSLMTIFLFLLAQMLLKPYLNQGLNVFQRLSLISQWFTVFGGICFKMVDYIDTQYGNEPSGARDVVGTLIFICNVAAAALYPLYRLFDAYAESREIDWDIVTKILNIEALQPVYTFFSCCVAAKDTAQNLRETSESAVKARALAFGTRAAGGDDQAQSLKDKYALAKEAHATVKAAQGHVEGVKASKDDLTAAGKSLYTEAGVAQESDIVLEDNGDEGAGTRDLGSPMPRSAPNLQVDSRDGVRPFSEATLVFAGNDTDSSQNQHGAPVGAPGMPVAIANQTLEFSSQPGMKIPWGEVERDATSLTPPAAPPRRNRPTRFGEA